MRNAKNAPITRIAFNSGVNQALLVYAVVQGVEANWDSRSPMVGLRNPPHFFSCLIQMFSMVKDEERHLPCEAIRICPCYAIFFLLDQC